jgi:uncharacterized protein (DUF849 family)
MQEKGVKPEIEVFDPGMIYNAAYLLKNGFIKAPLHFQFCMGVAGGIRASVKNLVFMRETMAEVAPGSTWSAFGVGSGALEILYAAVAMGGHVRVGMEDNVLYRRVCLPRHVPVVAQAKRLSRVRCEPPPAEARRPLDCCQERNVFDNVQFSILAGIKNERGDVTYAKETLVWFPRVVVIFYQVIAS